MRMVEVGDTVELVGQRDEETAQLFGGGQKPATATVMQPVLTAQVVPAPAVPADEPTPSTSDAAKNDGAPVVRIAVGGSW